MKTAYIKENFRELKKSKTRFISLVLLVMLGVLFFSGMNSVSPDMGNTMNKYLKDYNVSDVQIMSELGFTNDDVDAIKKVENVTDVIPGYTYDVIIEKDGKRMPVRTNSIEKNQQVNKIQIVDGRNVENDNECLIDERLVEDRGYKLGDKLSLKSGNDDNINEKLKNTEYTIVGKIRTPSYISKYYGSTDLENGELLGCIFLLKDVYKSDVYTNIYVKTNISNDILKLSDEYKENLKDTVSKIENIGKERGNIRYNQVFDENNQKIVDAKHKLQDAKDKLSDAKNQLNDARNQLNDLALKIYDGKNELNDTVEKVSKTFANYDSDLRTAKNEINSNSNKINNSKDRLQDGKKQYEAGKLEYENKNNQLKELDKQIDMVLYKSSFLDKNSGDYLVLNRKLGYMQQMYNDGTKALAEAKTKLDNAKLEIDENEKELEAGERQLNDAEAQYDVSDNTLNEQKDQYYIKVNKSSNSISYYERVLKEGREQYYKNLDEYNNKVSDAEKEIKDKENDVKDAQNKLDKISGKWYVIGLYDNSGFVSFKNDLEKIGIMGKVFPVMFFVVVTLVSITTITRMIEEDRGTIATEKALGYGKMSILFKYIKYAFSAATLGVIIGTGIGSYVITQVLYNAYRILYAEPDLITEINITYLLISIAITFVSTVLCAIIITAKELNCKTAELMRPKAPKEGKEIFLEKITPGLWEKLSFLFKISIRNIFRYKRRLFMAVIGIAGCTALIYAGLSLKQSIDKIAIKQYGEIKSYDMQINLDYEMNEDTVKDTLDHVKNTEKVTDATCVREKSTDAKANGVKKTVFYLVGNDDEVSNFIKLQNRLTKNKLHLQSSGIIISEKLANTLSVKVGDKITIVNDDKEKQVSVTGITENYLFNYIYMSPEAYEQIFEEDMLYNEILANTDELDEAQEKDMAQALKNDNKITGISLTRVVNKTYIDSLQSLTSIVFLCIGCASLLSFIVLFNLNSINIEERKRELATIKVLGFFDKEVSSYVFRENIILTIIGGLFGLVLGTIILIPIMKSAEVETIFLPVDLNIMTFVISFLVTLLFTLITNKLMNNRLRKIDMLDSLKSVE